MGDKIPPQTPISILPQEGEQILRQLAKLDRKVGERLDSHERDIKELHQAVQGCTLNNQALTQLSSEVRAVLARDVDHEKRLGELEKIAHDSGKSAGQKAGLGMGGLGAALVTIIIYVAQLLQQQGPPPVVPRQEKSSPIQLVP